jgi:peptide-methionine (S)-S-oxide reductase
MAKGMFGAGCFWGVESAFRRLKGVTNVTVGYSGGTAEEPTYEQVCSGTTGHAEVVLVEYDEARVAYDDLLGLFFEIHDPTQLNRQGPDVGTQYRSAVFTFDDDQKAAAQAKKDALGETARRPVATEIAPAATFWPAEDYHQQYEEKRMAASARLFGGWKR